MKKWFKVVSLIILGFVLIVVLMVCGNFSLFKSSIFSISS